MIRPQLRFPAAVAVAVTAALCIAGPASAHIHTDPPEVAAGTATTIGFIVEHGCEDSPTTKVEIQMPAEASGLKGVDGDGFTTSVDGRVVTFSGGSLPSDTEKAFRVSFTAPSKAGEYPVKLVQTCEQGSLDWIEIEVDGQPEPEHPAPVIKVTGTAPATTTTVAASTTAGQATTTTAAAAPSGTTTSVVVGSASSDDSSKDEDSAAPFIVGGIIAVLVIAGGVLIAARRRSADAPID